MKALARSRVWWPGMEQQIEANGIEMLTLSIPEK